MRDYTFSDQPQPHTGRGRAMMKAHPELRQYFGHYPLSFAWILLLTTIQLSLAYLLREQSWWLILLVTYTIGAICNHGLFAFVHEAAHNMVFKSGIANKWAGIMSNVAQGFPSALSFRKFHLYHHTNMGEYDIDADLASHREAKWVGNSPLRKTLWYFFFLFVEAFRPGRLKIKLTDNWFWVNFFVILACDALIWYAWGFKALAYLFISTFFSVGLHPVGARWIQEHYMVRDDQETYSYYGKLGNLFNFNIGYHQEHHDLWRVPWVHLPKLKKIAPEFYDDLYAHQSWTKLLIRFIFDRNLDLYSRIIRGETSLKQQKEFIESGAEMPSVFTGPESDPVKA